MAVTRGKGHRSAIPSETPVARVDAKAVSEQMLDKVRGQVEPAFAFAVSYLRILQQNLGLGALAVWFGTQGIEQYLSGNSKELDWHDMLSDLVRTSAPLSPKGLSTFCATLRRRQEARRRCRECDACWIARTRKTGRTWTYQCHAGLSEVVTPIVVNGKCVGEVMGGQLASTDDLPNGFEDVWQRISDIDGLNRHELALAFESLRPADSQHLNRVRISLQAAARALGALIESVADLMSRETMLGQVRSHLERDFAWFALTQPDASPEEIGARAKALGFTETPNIAIVVQPDYTNRVVLAGERNRVSFDVPALFEKAQRLFSNVPNSVVSSIRPDELVVLFSPGQTRNPALRNVRVRELVASLKREIETQSSTPVLIGVGGLDTPWGSAANAYTEARNAMQPAPDSDVTLLADSIEDGHSLVARMAALGRESHAAFRDSDRKRYSEIVEAQMRLIAGPAPNSDEIRRCLLSQAVFDTLLLLRNNGSPSTDRIHLAFATGLASLRTGAEMVEWMQINVVPALSALWEAPQSISARRVGKAGDILSRGLAEAPSREDVAHTLGLSGSILGKSFRKQTGVTYREYLRLLRMRQAQRLLLIPGKPVAQVATEVGYTTTAAFSRAFEKVCGASPIAYRNNPRAFPPIVLPEGCDATA
ncbi:MAG: PocR ligand-binding domain-containing protein [Candidatus Hydrogenedentes bacterium]|nr:PocR ligand-binding domain-containing protein [Candidatus Hydrogenedentota bacterium]